MLRRVRFVLLADVLAWLAFSLVAAAAPPAPAEPGPSTGPRSPAVDQTTTHTVAKTFDQSSFSYQMKLLECRPGYQIFKLSYPSPVKTAFEPNNTIPAEYYEPTDAEHGPRRPAVLVLHILNGNFELERLLCSSLAAHGIPAVMIKLPYYGERSLPGGQEALTKRPELFAEAIPQGILDARRTLDLLASRTEVDPEKLGVTGISLGGLMAGATAGADPRVHRACLMLAGGDLLAIIAHAREARELNDFLQHLAPAERKKFEQAITGVDPLTVAPALKERATAGRVLMMNATEDDVIPKACTEKLANALGIKDHIVWFEGLGHYTAIAALPQSFVRLTDFFGQDLPPEVKVSAPAGPPPGSPVSALTTMLKQAASFVTAEPSAGHCHLIDLSAKVMVGQDSHAGHLRLVHGAEFQFRIEATVDDLVDGTWAQSDRPWMASGTTVFRGEKPEKRRDPLSEADPKHVVKYKTLAGGLGGLLLLPGILEQTLDVQKDTHPQEALALKIGVKGKAKDEVRMVFGPEGQPRTAEFHIGDASGTVTFNAWQFDTIAPAELFDPPAGRPIKAVDTEDIYRTYGAIFDYLMELSD
jgi:dienelactone hydrolase